MRRAHRTSQSTQIPHPTRLSPAECTPELTRVASLTKDHAAIRRNAQCVAFRSSGHPQILNAGRGGPTEGVRVAVRGCFRKTNYYLAVS
jgi:hypothetical protein